LPALDDPAANPGVYVHVNQKQQVRKPFVISKDR
jgi:hypothetical protein